MFTKLHTVEELKAMFVEILMNKTSEITKVSKGSVLNGVAFGTGKLAQKINKDVAILESHMFPDMAVEQHLDDISRLEGVSQRFGARQSSTYVRVVGDVGTQYLQGSHKFVSDSGIQFSMSADYTIGVHGFGYIKIRSDNTGSNTNVDALSINKMTAEPIGHTYAINEFAAHYGADREGDDVFRKRIKEGVDLLSKSTISCIEQVFLKSNENILKVYYGGIDNFGRILLLILSENGIDFTTPEFNDIVLRSEKYFSLNEFRPANFNGYGVQLRNIEWQPIDISMRVDVDASYDANAVRKDVQFRLNKYLDYRYWKAGSMLEWDNLLDIVKNTEGIRYVNDSYFYPSNDIQTDIFKLPRIRGFQMLDLQGNVITDIQGNLNPMYYPQNKDFRFQASVLQTI